MAILSANEVHYSYKSKYQTVHAVRGVTYNFESGKFYAIVGVDMPKLQSFPAADRA